MTDTTVPASADADLGRADKTSPLRVSRRTFMLGVAITGAAILGLYVYGPQYYQVGTDDAAVAADIVPIVPKISGYVSTLNVSDNSRFEAGQQLLQIDDRDYRAAYDTAAAELGAAEATKATAVAQLSEQVRIVAADEAVIPADAAALDFASQQLQRARQLEQGGFGSTERRQSAQSEIAQRKAAVRKDQDVLEAARAHVQVLQAGVREADADIARRQAQLVQARLNLSYTQIFAPAAGSVASRSVQVGSFVQPGQTLLSAVPRDPYIVANFKETQLDRMRVGQPVSIYVDAYPGRSFRGHVDSFQQGTGSTFALLPPENATGNFVKVVQRVPVKILVDEPADETALLAPGMSVEPYVTVRRSPKWLSWLTQ